MCEDLQAGLVMDFCQETFATKKITRQNLAGNSQESDWWLQAHDNTLPHTPTTIDHFNQIDSLWNRS